MVIVPNRVTASRTSARGRASHHHRTTMVETLRCAVPLTAVAYGLCPSAVLIKVRDREADLLPNAYGVVQEVEIVGAVRNPEIVIINAGSRPTNQEYSLNKIPECVM